MNYIELKQLEQEWRDTQERYTTQELLEIFPEVEDVISDKIKELNAEIIIRQETLNKLRKVVNENIQDKDNMWFFREYQKVFYKQDINELEKEVGRWIRLKNKDRKMEGQIDEDDIERARQEPIENYLPRGLQKFGNKHRCSCPLHNEKEPSFYVYKKNNSFYCFGCKEGGDVITLVQKLNGFDFISAVKYILNK